MAARFPRGKAARISPVWARQWQGRASFARGLRPEWSQWYLETSTLQSEAGTPGVGRGSAGITGVVPDIAIHHEGPAVERAGNALCVPLPVITATLAIAPETSQSALASLRLLVVLLGLSNSTTRPRSRDFWALASLRLQVVRLGLSGARTASADLVPKCSVLV